MDGGAIWVISFFEYDGCDGYLSPQPFRSVDYESHLFTNNTVYFVDIIQS